MTDIRPAAPELLDLAAAVRPDWDRDRLHGALVAAHAAGWKWERTLREVTRLLLIEDSRPDDLRVAAGETRTAPRGTLAEDARAEVLAAAEAATRRRREQAKAAEGGTAA